MNYQQQQQTFTPFQMQSCGNVGAAAAAPKITFLTRDSTQEFVLQDEDMYVSKLTPQDVRARRCASNDEYKAVAIRACSEFSPAQKKVLTEASCQADVRLARATTFDAIIDLRVLADMPWKFACVTGTAYENGWPHTRSDVIFLSKAFFQHYSPALGPLTSAFRDIVETLIHEKVHVFQRAYPELMRVYNMSHGFERIAPKAAYDRLDIRSNPDLDGFVYSKHKRPCFVRYRSSHPSGMDDTEDVGPTEHPNEEMAYRLAAAVVGKQLKMKV